jgi:hypothetical protein
VPSQHHVTLLCVVPPPRSLISSPADRWSSPSMSPKVGASRPVSRALLRSPPPFEDPLGEFPWMRHVHRVKPRRKWCPVARATPGSGEPPPWPHLSHPCLDRRPKLDRRYPFVLIKSESFNQSSMAQVHY